MILCGHQPSYLPGLQFFSKVMHSDAFMYVPHCQYVAGSWHTHNFIRTGRITVPVHATLGDSLNEVKIDYTKNWQRKHLRAIEMAYVGSDFFRTYYNDLHSIINFKYPNLAKLNIALIDYLTQALGCGKFDKCFYTSSNGSHLNNSNPIDMIVSMCKQVNCDTYLSNEGSHAYIDNMAEKRMADSGITHRWFTFTDPDYGQGENSPNERRLSVLDILFTQGPRAAPMIYAAGGIL